MLNLSALQSRLAAVGLLLLVLAVIFYLAVLPAWQGYHENQAAIEQYQDNIARFDRIAEKSSQLAAVVRELEQREDISQYTLAEGSSTLAAAALQERLKLIVEQNDGSLVSTQILPVSEEEAFQRVTVKVRMTVNNEALRSILHELEGGQPYLFVDNLSIIARTRRRNSRTGKKEQSDLDVRFDLYGYMRPRADNVTTS